MLNQHSINNDSIIHAHMPANVDAQFEDWKSANQNTRNVTPGMFRMRIWNPS